MPAPAENALESRVCAINAQILVNQEITSRCRWTKACGENCILAATNRGAGPTLTNRRILDIARELTIGPAAALVRHYCAAGKEAFEAPETLVEIAAMWNATAPQQRCGSIGAITGSLAGVRSTAPLLAERGPLSWVLGSLDVDLLRHAGNNLPLLEALAEGRRVGGFGAFGVNTQFQGKNLEPILAIGHAVADFGADQWSVGPWLAPQRGMMASTVSLDQTRQLLDRIASDCRLAASPMATTVDVPFATFVELVGTRATPDSDLNRWRFEYPITRNVRLIALNPAPHRFLRVRWDGQMLSLEDFLTVGLREGSHGMASPAKVRATLQQLAEASRGVPVAH